MLRDQPGAVDHDVATQLARPANEVARRAVRLDVVPAAVEDGGGGGSGGGGKCGQGGRWQALLRGCQLLAGPAARVYGCAGVGPPVLVVGRNISTKPMES